jgi:hypothetical protein
MKKSLIIKDGKNEQIYPLLNCVISKGAKSFYIYFTEQIHIKLPDIHYNTVKEFLLDGIATELTIESNLNYGR